MQALARGRSFRADLDNPFPHLGRVDPRIGAEQSRPSLWSIDIAVPFVFVFVFVFVTFGLELLENVFERLPRGEQADPVSLVGEGGLEDPPRRGVDTPFFDVPERLLDLVQVVHEELVELVGERTVEVDSFRCRPAQGGRRMLRQVERDRVRQVRFAD